MPPSASVAASPSGPAADLPPPAAGGSLSVPGDEGSGSGRGPGSTGAAAIANSTAVGSDTRAPSACERTSRCAPGVSPSLTSITHSPFSFTTVVAPATAATDARLVGSFASRTSAPGNPVPRTSPRSPKRGAVPQATHCTAIGAAPSPGVHVRSGVSVAYGESELVPTMAHVVSPTVDTPQVECRRRPDRHAEAHEHLIALE